jgi:hypothetical protein
MCQYKKILFLFFFLFSFFFLSFLFYQLGERSELVEDNSLLSVK